MHSDALSALGIGIWSPVCLHNAGKNSASLTGKLAWEEARDTVIIDSLTAEDLGVTPGDKITVLPVPRSPAKAVWLAPVSTDRLPVEGLRAALLGKPVVSGARESLLPQDYTRTFSKEDSAGITSLRQHLGPTWQSVTVKVVRTVPSGVVIIAAETEVNFTEGCVVPSQTSFVNGFAPAFNPAGKEHEAAGMEVQFAEVKEVLELPFLHADLLHRLGVKAPHGMLLQGPPGSGKSSLVQMVCALMHAPLVQLDGVDLVLCSASAAADALTDAFALDQHNKPPHVVLIKNVDRIAPTDNEAQGAAVGARFLSLLDQAKEKNGVFVVATTAHPGQCASALFEAGRIDRRIDIPLPDRAAREKMLAVHTRPLPLAEDVSLSEIATRTPGFVGADLAKLCRQAAMSAAARLKNTTEHDRIIPLVETTDFGTALERVQPSALGSEQLDTGNVTWADVGNAQEVKQQLTETILWPIRFPDTFQRLGIDPPGGILLYGAPGCGKTLLVQALANEAEANLVSVKGAELLSKWVGESEAGVRDIFRRARSAAPAILFFDEIDALAPQREGASDAGITNRVVAQMLTEINGIEPLRGVAVIGATNRPDLVDAALLRPGRLERHVFVDMPGTEAREQVLVAACRKMPLDHTLDFAALSRKTPGFSAADLAALAREAGYAAMRRDPAAARVTTDDFATALGKTTPSVTSATLACLRGFAKRAENKPVSL